MKREYLIVLVVVLALGVGAVALRGAGRDQAVVEELPTVENSEEIGENTVIYRDSGFTPSSLSIQVGTTVKFINQSSKPMWVASDPHPVHTGYSAFDQLSDGEEYSFTFSEAGSYRYHNHLFPTDAGVVSVE